MIELLTQLGFINKPWKGYPDTWWFRGYPILTLSAIRKPSDIIRTCLISWTPEALIFSDMTETERKERVNDMLSKL